MKIAIGADHGAYELKQKLIPYLKELGHEVVDYGTNSTVRCDYPDFAFMVAQAVSLHKCEYGIMLDSVGVGSTIMCNKVPGVRAAMCNEIYTARNSKMHNGSNVLCMGAQIIGEALAKEIVKVWLSTDLEGERNIKRVNMICDIENRILGCNR